MKRSEHKCAVETCANICPRAYPFCYSCWLDVPAELRKEVRQALKAGATERVASAPLVDVVRAAAASVREVELSGSSMWASWERAYLRAGSPEFAEVVATTEKLLQGCADD
jgi:hypothetical protein